jgi:TonB family protein
VPATRAPIATALAALALLAVAAAAEEQPRPLDGDEVEEPADGGPADAGAPDAGTPDAWKMPFNPESIRSVVLSHEPDVRACYEATLAEGRDVQGEVVVSVVVTPDGIPDRARVKRSTLRDKQIEECVVRTVRRWWFPRPARRQPLDLPFRFSEVGSKAAGAPDAGAAKPYGKKKGKR